MERSNRSTRRWTRWGLAAAAALAVTGLASGPPSRAAEPTDDVGAAGAEAAPPAADEETSVEAGPAGMNIELHAQEEDLGTVLEMLSRQAEVNIVASRNVSGKVTADLYNVTVEEVLQAVSRANDLRWVREGDFIYVHTPEEMKAIKESDERLQTQVFPLNYLTAEEARKLIAPALSEKGTVAETTPSETGIPTASANVGGDSYPLPDTIIVRDFPENLDQVGKILGRMDRRPRQVLVEATILAVTLNDETDLGVNFNALAGVDFRDLSSTVHPVTDPTNVPNAAGTTLDVQQQTRFGHIFGRGFASLGDGLNIGVMTNSVSVFINALEEVKDTTILSNPKVLAVNKQPAEVNVGDQIGYRGDVTSTETSEVSEAEFLDVGTVLRFRPYISDDGYVRLEVHPEVSQRGEETIDGVPSKRTTQVTCNVLIRDSHTLVIGGLFDETTSIDRGQIPGLGNVPGLGVLFRNKTDATTRNEIIILLTPHIIDHEEANRLGEELRDDAKRRLIGMREGFYFFTRDRLTVRYVQEADEHYRNYLRTRNSADLDRAWWHTQLALNVAPNNLHAIHLKDRILMAKNRGPRPQRSWTIWDKISADIKPYYLSDDRPQDERATAEEGRRPRPRPIGDRPAWERPGPVLAPPAPEGPPQSRAKTAPHAEAADEAAVAAAEDVEGPIPAEEVPLHILLGPAPMDAEDDPATTVTDAQPDPESTLEEAGDAPETTEVTAAATADAAVPADQTNAEPSPGTDEPAAGPVAETEEAAAEVRPDPKDQAAAPAAAQADMTVAAAEAEEEEEEEGR